MLNLLILWLWFCAYLNCAGWLLSALHQLNAFGYSITLAVGFGLLALVQKKTGVLRPLRLRYLFRRLKKPLPAAFAIVVGLAFLGGLLHHPNNYDASAYRLPRVLHWLDAGGWHWIHTDFPRLNARACGVEWVSAPVIALLKTDRPLFLINIVSIAFLPGLLFSLFTRLGVKRKVAAHWMWLIPTGYCFVLQAGGTGNDLFGAPFVLAAVDFALRASKNGSRRDFFASILAAALVSSAKLSNVPLLLPWALAILPCWRLLLRWPVTTFGICIIAAFASIFPTAWANARHYNGDWSGWKAESAGVVPDPILRIGANSVLITVQNLCPPVFPLANRWNRFVIEHTPPGLAARLYRTMNEHEAAELTLDVLQIEEGAGVGFGVTVLLIGSVIGAIVIAQKKPLSDRAGGSFWITVIRLSPYVSLLAILVNSNVGALSRVITPYFCMLFPIWLALRGHEWIVRFRIWRLGAFVVFLIAGGLLIISPSRPLLPFSKLLNNQNLVARHPLLARARNVYSVYAGRWDAFAPARDLLPPDVKVIGLVTYDEPEVSLWRPFGSRAVQHVTVSDTGTDLRNRGIRWILAPQRLIDRPDHLPLDEWLKLLDAEVVHEFPLNIRASTGPGKWYWIYLRDRESSADRIIQRR